MKPPSLAAALAFAATLAPVFAETPPTYIVTTVAGMGTLPYTGEGQKAPTVDLFSPHRVAVDHSGVIYLTEDYYHRVLRIATDGTLTTLAGGGSNPLSGQPARATDVSFGYLEGIAADPAGNVYVGGDNRLWKVSTNGNITLVGGTGDFAYAGDGGPATAAKFGTPESIALDASGNIYFSDYSFHVVRRIDTEGSISTVAGTGQAGYSNDGQPATSAQLNTPAAIAFDQAGNLYIADSLNCRIRKVDLTGTIATVAGTGAYGYPEGQGLLARQADLFMVYGLAVDTAGNVYFSGSETGLIEVLNTQGLLNTVSREVQGSWDLAMNADGSLAAVDGLRRGVYGVSLPAGHASLLAGIVRSEALGDGGPALQALLRDPHGLALDGHGNLFLGDYSDYRLRRIASNQTISTVAGTGVFGDSGDGGAATAAEVSQPSGVAVDSAGNLYFASACRIRVIRSDGTMHAEAGTSDCGYSEPLLATAAMMNFPTGLAVDAAGNLYVSDTYNQSIRKVTPQGTILTIAGSGEQGYAGNHGSDALAASLNNPRGLAVDAQGNLYFADEDNHRVRKVTSGGGIFDVAGTGTNGNTGDFGPATAAELCWPTDVALDSAGNVYIATCGLIRRVGTDGRIATIAGSGDEGFSGDGDLATLAGMDPFYLTVDSQDHIYFSDNDNFRVRRLDRVQIFPAGVKHGATFQAGPTAPGEIVTVYGSGLGPATLVRAQLDPSGPPLPTTLAGVQITFDGVAAPLLYVSANQSAAIVPFDVAGQTSTVLQVVYQNVPTNAITLPVAGTSPGVFTIDASGNGQGAILNQNYSMNSASQPAAPGDIIMLFGTGGGQTVPASLNGHYASDPDHLAAPVTASIGGLDAEVIYAGSAPTLVAGVFQINVRVPNDAPAGDAIAIRVTIGSATSPDTVTVAIRRRHLAVALR